MCKERQMDFKRNNMKKIYLSGPVSGRPLEEARVQFGLAEEFLLKHFGRENVMVFNPMKFTEYAPDKKWQDYMHTCLAVLEQCDEICMLGGWLRSLGAQVEYLYAEGCGIPAIAILGRDQSDGPATTKRVRFRLTDGVQYADVMTDERRGHAVVDDSEQPNSL